MLAQRMVWTPQVIHDVDDNFIRRHEFDHAAIRATEG